MITLMVAKANMSSDISPADFVFHVLITCGKKVMAEILPAAIPSICIEVISKYRAAPSPRRGVTHPQRPAYLANHSNIKSSNKQGLCMDGPVFSGIGMGRIF
jgi:hypothetical protein